MAIPIFFSPVSLLPRDIKFTDWTARAIYVLYICLHIEDINQ